MQNIYEHFPKYLSLISNWIATCYFVVHQMLILSLTYEGIQVKILNDTRYRSKYNKVMSCGCIRVRSVIDLSTIRSCLVGA